MSLNASYFLGRHVHLCVGADRVVMLDLARNNFLAIPIGDTRGLGAWIRGWPASGGEDTEPAVLEELLAEGLVTRESRNGRQDSLLAVAISPREALGDTTYTGTLQVRWGDVWRFIFSCLFAFVVLRVIPVRHVVALARRWKSRHRHFDLEKAQRLLATFEYLYPWFFTRQDECLKNSFSLLVFLSRYGLSPDWVFAVRTHPFAAHCWLQHGDVVLNDTIKGTASLSPIMVV